MSDDNDRIVAAILASQAAAAQAKGSGDFTAKNFVRVYREMLSELREEDKHKRMATVVNEFVNESTTRPVG